MTQGHHRVLMAGELGDEARYRDMVKRAKEIAGEN
jgi:hypothetical protein